MAFCTNRGAQVGEGDTFCTKCKQKLHQKDASGLVCPKCGSENIQRYSLWKKSTKKGSAVAAGLGCLTSSLGCLIFVLLLIFAPLLLLLLGIGLAVVLPIIMAVFVIVAVAYAIQQNMVSSRYICLKCGLIFKP